MSWRYTISKQETALREYHASFPWAAARQPASFT
jgi:hypothetical protein